MMMVVKRNGYPRAELFLEKVNEFVRCDETETLGVVINLIRNVYEPILVEEGGKVVGMISGSEIMQNSRVPYRSKVTSNITSKTLVKTEDGVDKAIKQMVIYNWHRIPIFDRDDNVVGQLSARNILRKLVGNRTFLNFMILRSEIRKPALLEASGKIGDALEIMRGSGETHIFLIDKDGKYEGTVTRESLFKAFNKSVESKHYSTKEGGLTGNIYTGEKIDRDDYPLALFASRKRLRVVNPETGDKEMLVKKLVRAKVGHNLVVTDDKNIPIGIIGLGDLLSAILVEDKSLNSKIKYREWKDVGDGDRREIDRMMIEFDDYVGQFEKVDEIEVSNKEVKTAQGKVNVYELLMLVKLKSGETYTARENSRQMVAGVRRLVDKVRKQMSRENDLKNNEKV